MKLVRNDGAEFPLPTGLLVGISEWADETAEKLREDADRLRKMAASPGWAKVGWPDMELMLETWAAEAARLDRLYQFIGEEE